jgi:hypothetical protein
VMRGAHAVVHLTEDQKRRLKVLESAAAGE